MSNQWYLVTYPNGIKQIEQFASMGEVSVKESATGNPLVLVSVSIPEKKETRKDEKRYTFICAERNFTINISDLTWQQALIEQSRKFWEYNDLLPQEMRDCDHVIPMLDSVITIV